MPVVGAVHGIDELHGQTDPVARLAHAHAPLNCHGARHGIHHTGELDQRPVAAA